MKERCGLSKLNPEYLVKQETKSASRIIFFLKHYWSSNGLYQEKCIN